MPASSDDKIRFALEPNNTKLIAEYIAEYECVNLTKNDRRQHLEQQFRILLETVADECLPVHWRQLCLDSIYKPLSGLWRIADTENSRTQVRYLFTELRVIGQYLEPGLSA